MGLLMYFKYLDCLTVVQLHRCQWRCMDKSWGQCLVSHVWTENVFSAFTKNLYGQFKLWGHLSSLFFSLLCVKSNTVEGDTSPLLPNQLKKDKNKVYIYLDTSSPTKLQATACLLLNNFMQYYAYWHQNSFWSSQMWYVMM